MNERRNVVRLAVQHPARLFRREAGGQLPQERQETVLIFFHSQNQSPPAPENEQRFYAETMTIPKAWALHSHTVQSPHQIAIASGIGIEGKRRAINIHTRDATVRANNRRDINRGLG